MTNYLTADAVAAVLRWIASSPGPTALVFTYVHAGLLDGSVEFEGGVQILANVQKLGEPWTFGLRPPEVGAFLANCGLTLQEELGADDYRARYLPTAPHGYAGYAFYRSAVAAVLLKEGHLLRLLPSLLTCAARLRTPSALVRSRLTSDPCESNLPPASVRVVGAVATLLAPQSHSLGERERRLSCSS